MDKSATETTRATSLRTPLQPLRHRSSKSCADKPFKIEDNDKNAPNGVCNMDTPISHLQHGQLCDLTKEEASSHPATLLYQNMSLRQLQQTALPRLAETIPFGAAAAIKPISELASAGYVHVKDCKYSITNGVTGSSFLSKRGITEARETLGRFRKETKCQKALGVVIVKRIVQRDHQLVFSEAELGGQMDYHIMLEQKLGGQKVVEWLNRMRLPSMPSAKVPNMRNNLVSAGKNVITNPKILAGILDGFLDLKTTSYQFGDALSVAGESWFNDSVISIGLDWIIKTSELGSLAQIKSPDVTLFMEAQASKCSTAEFVIQSRVSNNFDWKRGKLMVPMLGYGNHWTAGFVDIPAQEILYRDSKNPDASLPKYWRESIFAIMKRMGCPVGLETFSIYDSVKTINNYPKQKDSYNCGPCTLIALSEVGLYGRISHTTSDAYLVRLQLLRIILSPSFDQSDEAGSDSFNMSLQSNQGHIDRPLTPFAKNTACRSFLDELQDAFMYPMAEDAANKVSKSETGATKFSTS
ncbi:hypothetical protein HDU80_008944, partial [Chytriomyces hyalinus]